MNQNVINQNTDCHIVVGGDFNVDLSRNCLHTGLFNDFCEEADLVPTMRHSNCVVDYTYNFSLQRFNVLDHFILSGVIFETAVVSVIVIHDGENLSDHDCIILSLNLETNYMKVKEKVYKEKIAWHKADESCLTEYRCMLRQLLGSTVIPVDAITCHNPLCDSVAYSTALSVYACEITSVYMESAVATLPRTGERAQWRVPGWTEKVEPARRQSILWHNIWVECGSPKTVNVARSMRQTRAQYHYVVRSIKRDENNIVKQRFAEAVLKDGSRDFWKEVKKLNGEKSRLGKRC